MGPVSRPYDGTITTWTGAAFDFARPLESEIRLDDIAHSLGMLCRFNGHIRRFYSVAQHSVLVSRLVEPEHALHALFHDAPEAYVGDMTAPLKKSMGSYQELEAKVAINIRAELDLGLLTDGDAPIKAADGAALELEVFCLTNRLTPSFRLMEDGATADVLEATRQRADLEDCTPDRFMPPPDAAALFLRREQEIRGGLVRREGHD